MVSFRLHSQTFYTLICAALAHEHHNVEEIDVTEPIDAILWIHVSNTNLGYSPSLLSFIRR